MVKVRTMLFHLLARRIGPTNVGDVLVSCGSIGANYFVGLQDFGF